MIRSTNFFQKTTINSKRFFKVASTSKFIEQNFVLVCAFFGKQTENFQTMQLHKICWYQQWCQPASLKWCPRKKGICHSELRPPDPVLYTIGLQSYSSFYTRIQKPEFLAYFEQNKYNLEPKYKVVSFYGYQLPNSTC